MAGILYEPAPAPTVPSVAPVSARSGLSPQSFRDKDKTYNDLLAQVLGTPTTGWLDGLAKMATSGFLGYQKSRNQDKADTERASAGDAYAKLLEALTGGKGASAPASASMAPAAAPAGSAGLTDALVQSRTGGVGKLPPDMIQKESGGRQFARDGKPLTSPAGAIGIAQVMPATGPEAAHLAGMPWDPQRFQNDPTYNEALGAAYYQDQMQRFGDPELARAAYNAGPGRTGQYVNGDRPLPAETVAYADMNGDGRIGGMGGGMPQQQGPQVAALGAGDMPLNPGGPEMPASMQGGYQPIGTQPPQQMAQGGPGGQGQQAANPQMQAALAILANPWADEGQKQVAGMILQSAMKQNAPVQWEKLNDTTLYNPVTQETKAVGAGSVSGKPLAPGNFDDQAKLRGEFLQQSKDFVAVRDAFGRLQAASQDTTGASDVAMVYGFMKMLDPGSVVREGEFATAENTAGIPDQVRQLYNRALTGERLPPQVRQDFMQQAGRQFTNAKARQDATVEQYSSLAKSYGFDPALIGIDLTAGVGIPPAPAAAGPAAPMRAVNPQTGEAVIFNGSAWVPEGPQ